jgi:hypothetical protein
VAFRLTRTGLIAAQSAKFPTAFSGANGHV